MPDLIHELLLHSADKAPQRAALAYRNIRLDYAALAGQVRQSCAGFRRLGLQRSARVAVYLEKRPETVVATVGDGTVGAGVRALGAEQAPPKVDAQLRALPPDGIRGAGVGTEGAARAALGRIDLGPPSKAIGQRRLPVGIGDRAMPLTQARREGLQHRNSLEIMATVREVQALVAQGEVRDLLVAQRHG